MRRRGALLLLLVVLAFFSPAGMSGALFGDRATGGASLQAAECFPDVENPC